MEFSVEKMCACFKVSPNAFYDWKSGKSTKRIQREKMLSGKIKQIWERSFRTYGSPRVWEELRRAEGNVSRSLTARVMRKHGFLSVHKKKFKVTTDSKHSYPVSENVLNREFSADRIAQKWVSDLTYIHTKEGWLYLTVVIDLFDRKVIGWSYSSGMTAQETVIPAWRMAIRNRPIQNELIFHSDRGVQYACKAFRNLIDNKLITQSMSRKGNCWDNAVAESFFKTLKVERVYRKTYATRNEAEMDLFQYIEGWYNTRRIHSANNQKSIWQINEIEKNNYISNVA
jgi:transposase InsO family protein